MSDRPIKLVLIDDHALFTRGLELLLEVAAPRRVRVVATTDRPELGLQLVQRFEPDVAVVDVAMPPPGGLAVMAAVKRACPAVRVLALSGVDGVENWVETLRHGADGFLEKTSAPDELVAPLLALVEGSVVLPRELLTHLLADAATAVGEPGLLERVDDDERGLWRMIAQGAPTEEVARHRHVSERTAKRAIAALLRKIGAANRVHAAALAGRCGLLDADVPGGGEVKGPARPLAV